VYKVIAENDQFVVVQVAWKPGQADQMHSHPAAAVYFLDDCTLRFRLPDGSSRDTDFPKAGKAVVQAAVPAHSVENIGPAECRMIMFEPKQ
jgi:hypothetical protein